MSRRIPQVPEDDEHTRTSVSEFRANLSETLSRVTYGDERFIVTRNGSEAVALIPLAAYRRFLEWQREQQD